MIREIFKDKNGFFNMRELTTALMVVIVTASWIGEQFFGFTLSPYMFYGFISLIGAGCFGYSIERKQRYLDNPQGNWIQSMLGSIVKMFAGNIPKTDLKTPTEEMESFSAEAEAEAQPKNNE